MKRELVRVELGQRSYDIRIGHECLADVGRELAEFGLSSKAALISNPTVDALYGDPVRSSLEEAGFEPVTALMEDGEEYKNIETVKSLWDQLLKARLDRRSPVVALGGGVVGDVAGFVAATYMRGIPYIQAPTTLLAQVDSSVGGKTGIDHPEGKNLIGAFYQPKLVWIDTGTLKTLDAREVHCGLAEVIKYGIISDENLFQDLEENIEAILNLDTSIVGRVIRRSCEIKADIVSRDEKEGGVRAILNFGHTVGHAVEAELGYTEIRHGEGVAIGMVAETRLAVNRNMIAATAANRLRNLLEKAGLPVKIPKSAAERLIHRMTADKKSRSGKIRIVLPTEIGNVLLPQSVEPEELEPVLEELMDD
jgi:3-dehydroquinate synthase